VYGALCRVSRWARHFSLYDTWFVLTALIDGRRAPADGRAGRNAGSAQQALAVLAACGTLRRVAHLGERTAKLEDAMIGTFEFVDGHGKHLVKFRRQQL
jgi:hypothetical protein